jgi:hypothetical protein
LEPNSNQPTKFLLMQTRDIAAMYDPVIVDTAHLRLTLSGHHMTRDL